jgi:hypothetical protein
MDIAQNSANEELAIDSIHRIYQMGVRRSFRVGRTSSGVRIVQIDATTYGSSLLARIRIYACSAYSRSLKLIIPFLILVNCDPAHRSLVRTYLLAKQRLVNVPLNELFPNCLLRSDYSATTEELDRATRQQRVERLEIIFVCKGTVNQA